MCVHACSNCYSAYIFHINSESFCVWWNLSVLIEASQQVETEGALELVLSDEVWCHRVLRVPAPHHTSSFRLPGRRNEHIIVSATVKVIVY